MTQAALSNRTKIVIVTHEFSPFRGGVATYCEEMANAAWQLGYPVEVWTQGSESNVTQFPYPVRRFKGNGTLKPGDHIRFASELIKHSHELDNARIYFFSRGAQQVAMHLRVCGWNPGLEWCFVFHGTELLKYHHNPWLNALARYCFPEIKLASASHHAKALMHQCGFEAFQKLTLVAPCALRECRANEALKVKQTDVTEDLNRPVRLLTLARIHPRKGQMEVAESLQLLDPSIRSRLEYHIAGTGDQKYSQQVVEQCSRSSVPCICHGEIPEQKMADMYAMSDIYIMASRTLTNSVEGFGMTYLEAGAFGKPCIGYNTGGVTDAVIHNKTGLLVPEGDREALAKAIHQLVVNSSLRMEMGQAGREAALASSWKKSAQILWDC